MHSGICNTTRTYDMDGGALGQAKASMPGDIVELFIVNMAMAIAAKPVAAGSDRDGLYALDRLRDLSLASLRCCRSARLA